MKLFIIGLLTTFSTITFASTVECDISTKLENGNYESIDSVTLGGDSGYSFVNEIGRAIKGKNNLYINARLGSDDSLAITLMSEHATRYIGKPLAEAAGNAIGLRLTSIRDGVSVLCMKK